LTPNVWQEQYCSTRQHADFEKSIPDFELMDIIDYIHKKGMRRIAKIYGELNRGDS